ncbi:MAG: hypothetical protein EB127_28400, partial [Alphaproteobacteria bacterium]|nr:hypothetical protein [Alphaproteobacteria bacterium]
MTEKIIVTEVKNDVVISAPGPQGPRGKTILNGVGAPINSLGVEGDFYYDKNTTKFYGPKLSDNTWAGATNYFLSTGTLTYPFSMSQVAGPSNGIWSLSIVHNLGYHPNVTVKTSAGDILETGIDYNSVNQITLTMAQPF